MLQMLFLQIYLYKKPIFVQNYSMSIELMTIEGSKKAKYEALLPQITHLIDGEPDLIANTANLAAILKQTFGFFWVGFYFVKENELVLGPFQGELACTRIQYGKGVCGMAFATKQTQLVADVDQFPGHIACSSQSKSEIVIPIFKSEEVVAVLDIDSDLLNDFDSEDQFYLEKLAKIIANVF